MILTSYQVTSLFVIGFVDLLPPSWGPPQFYALLSIPELASGDDDVQQSPFSSSSSPITPSAARLDLGSAKVSQRVIGSNTVRTEMCSDCTTTAGTIGRLEIPLNQATYYLQKKQSFKKSKRQCSTCNSMLVSIKSTDILSISQMPHDGFVAYIHLPIVRPQISP